MNFPSLDARYVKRMDWKMMRYPLTQLFMHLKSRAHKGRDLADLIQEEAHENDGAFNY
jgi:hypothetical protein